MVGAGTISWSKELLNKGSKHLQSLIGVDLKKQCQRIRWQICPVLCYFFKVPYIAWNINNLLLTTPYLYHTHISMYYNNFFNK